MLELHWIENNSIKSAVNNGHNLCGFPKFIVM